MTRRHGNADLWSAPPRGSAAGETDLTQRHGSRLGVSPRGTMTRRHGNADLWSAPPRGSAAGETDLTQRHGSRLGVSPRGTMTRRHGNADLRSAQPRGSAAGETDLTQRHGSRLGVSPRGTMTRRHGNADLRSAQPRGSAAGETDLTQRRGAASSALVSRSRAMPVGDRRSAVAFHLRGGRYASFAARRSAFQAVPAIWRVGGCVVRCPPATVPTGGRHPLRGGDEGAVTAPAAKQRRFELSFGYRF